MRLPPASYAYALVVLHDGTEVEVEEYGHHDPDAPVYGVSPSGDEQRLIGFLPREVSHWFYVENPETP